MQAHRRRPDSVFSTARYFVGVTPTHLQLALFDSLGAHSECLVHRISGKLNTGRPPRQYYPDPRGNHTHAAGGVRIFESSARGSETCAAFQTLIWGEPSNRLSRNDPLSDSGTVGETGTVVPKRMGVIRSSKMIIRFDEAARLMIIMKRPLG